MPTAVICLLRGVNVTGNNKIKMDTLKAICVSLKLGSPQTYIQSGNAVFTSREPDLDKLARKIEGAIERECGFRPAVFLRTAAEMRSVLARNPFAGRAGIEPGKLLVMFHSEEVEAAKLRIVKQAGEEIHFDGREAFIYYPDGQGKSRLSFAAAERGAKPPSGTGRNWNTVTKLLDMAEALLVLSLGSGA